MASYRRTYRVNSMTFRQPQERLASSRPTLTVIRVANPDRQTPVDPLFALYCLKVPHVSTSWMCILTLKDALVVVKDHQKDGFRIFTFFASSRTRLRRGGEAAAPPHFNPSILEGHPALTKQLNPGRRRALFQELEILRRDQETLSESISRCWDAACVHREARDYYRVSVSLNCPPSRFTCG